MARADRGGRPRAGGLNRFVGKHLLYSDPPRHTRLRRLVSKAFTPRRVAGYEPMITTVVDELLKQFDACDEIDLVGRFAVPIGTTVICEMLGIPAAERKDFRRWSLPLVSDHGPARSAEELAAGRRAALDQLSEYLGALIRHKRARPTSDLLSALIEARDGDGCLSEPELIAMALLLLIAGHETTVNFIGNATLALLDHPDQAELLRRRPDLLPGAIEELVRYEGSVMICSLRVTGEPVELAGVLIPAGELVMAVVAAADRDPARFADPQRLDVTRPANPHLGFGAGIHYCVGAPLARLQSRIAIGELLRRYPRMEPAVPRDELTWHPSITLRGLNSSRSRRTASDGLRPRPGSRRWEVPAVAADTSPGPVELLRRHVRRTPAPPSSSSRASAPACPPSASPSAISTRGPRRWPPRSGGTPRPETGWPSCRSPGWSSRSPSSPACTPEPSPFPCIRPTPSGRPPA